MGPVHTCSWERGHRVRNLLAAFVGPNCHTKFGRLRQVLRTDLSAELLAAVSESTSGTQDSLRADDERRLLHALRAGDESAFIALIETYHMSMLQLATVLVRNQAVAEEIVQEAWLGVLEAIRDFDERSSLKTWIFRILIETAKARAAREHSTVPVPETWDISSQPFQPALESERFRPPDAPQWAGGWVSFPPSWGDAPEERLLAADTVTCIRDAIEALPTNQRTVVELRDAQGWTADEVRYVLEISELGQRALLHRGRSKVRRSLERQLTGV